MRYLSYELLKLAEEFLGQLNYKKDVFSRNVHQLRELIERKQVGLAYKKIADSEKNLTRLNYPDDVYYYNRHLLKSLSNYLELIQDKTLNNDDIIAEGENIIILAFVVIFHTTFNLSIGKGTYNQEIPSSLIYNFLSELDTVSLQEKTKAAPGAIAETIEFYFRLMRLQTEPANEENYFILKSSFEHFADKINKEDLYNFYTALRSYSVQKMLRSRNEFRKEQFEIDKLAIKHDAYSPAKHKYFQLVPFRNYLNAAIVEGDFEWADELVKNYLHKVDPKYRPDMLNYSKAIISFMKNNFEDALKNINLLKGSNIFFKFDLRAYNLMIYYELGWYEPALEYIDSYRHFLNKNRSIGELRIKVVSNFVSFTNDLVKIKLNISKKSIPELKKEVQEASLVTNKTWLQNKIAELINIK